MLSAACEQAIKDAIRCRRAILKFISPNDVGLTGGHQCGYYLPKHEQVWPSFTTFPPTKGVNNDHNVEAVWPDGRVTNSIVKWYGVGTRSEYRLTHFGRDFPFLTDDCVGNLLVLIPEKINRFLMYVFDHEEDIEELQAALGVSVLGRWAMFDLDGLLPPETEEACMDRHFRHFAEAVSVFPPTAVFAGEARQFLIDCAKKFMSSPGDDKLMMCVSAEYNLFKFVERRICEPDVVRVFKSIDDFLVTAQTILQRRKARAGRSLEHHVEYLLREAGIPFDPGAVVDGTKPDILIPGRKEYLDPNFPTARLFVLGIKTTCKDRWRQVTKEAPRIEHKHILTLQQGISTNQLDEMEHANITLVVPFKLHVDYPPAKRPDLLTVGRFINDVRAALAH